LLIFIINYIIIQISIVYRSAESLPSTDYLVVQHPSDRIQTSPGGLAIQSSIVSNSNVTGSTNTPQTNKNTIMAKHHFPGNTSPQFCQYIIERSRHILQPLKRHKTESVRRLCSHPMLPLYLSGSQDGSVILWEWNHHQPISCPRPAGTFAKVTRVGFNQQGNKFGVTDGDGNLSLWQIATTQNKPFFVSHRFDINFSNLVIIYFKLLCRVCNAIPNKRVISHFWAPPVWS
jgi:WD40 repeat protein